MTTKTHYPSFNVMDEQDYWDSHTQQIVQARLEPHVEHKFLTPEEAVALTAISALLVDDNRYDILNYIVSHMDSKLASAVGEGQRGVNVPEARALVRGGLHALYQHTIVEHGTMFASLDEPVQRRILEELSGGMLKPDQYWADVPQQPLFNKLHGWAVEAYCSHPTVWSEIGYAGPAYPRGYTRMQIGQLDPWEAKSTS